jgi:hypothetical protein
MGPKIEPFRPEGPEKKFLVDLFSKILYFFTKFSGPL